MNRYIKLNENNKIVSTRIGPSIVDGEIESKAGELGQIMQTDGIFVNDATPPQAQFPTQLDEIQNTIDMLLLKQEGII